MRRTYKERQDRKDFRMSIVNSIKDLTPNDRARAVEEILSRKYAIPYSSKDMLSRGTIYRWLNEYRRNKDAENVLMVKERCDMGIMTVLTDRQKEALTRWRYDNPYRTVQDLWEELMEHEETTTDPMPSKATLARYLRGQGLSRTALIKGIEPLAKVRLAFEADYPQQIWMADTKGPDVYVDDPGSPGQKIPAKPIAIIDDNSRYLVAVLYVVVEDERAVMEIFCQAILLYGIPEILYLDRGSPYMGKSFKKAANLIGCNIIHAARRDCQAKGKILYDAFYYPHLFCEALKI